MKLYSKEELIEELKNIAKSGWIKNARKGNHGGIGNTLEGLLGIKENNLPIPNAAEWELKAQRLNTSSLTTLFHLEPSPRAVHFVAGILLPKYGWKHQKAGNKYSLDEKSFRQTLNSLCPSDRGFCIQVDRVNRKVLISFDSNCVSPKHSNWIDSVNEGVGLGQLNPTPYWGFDDLASKAGTKLLNCFYVQAEVKKEAGAEYYRYSKVTMLQNLILITFLPRLRMETY